MKSEKPQIGISACLLGQPVRFDGGHKRDRYITDHLSQHVDFSPFCPENEIGLGTPRPTLQLRQKEEKVRLVFSREPQSDLTDRMIEHARQRVENLGELDGVIFKKDSPSCGMERVAVVQNEHGYRRKEGVGVFANQFVQRWPLIPAEEEGRLHDLALRENFFERVYAYRRWKAIENPEKNVKGFIDFHMRHKLMLMARGQQKYRELGRIVAGVTRQNLAHRRQQYIELFMKTMALRANRGGHVNVLQHVMGYFKPVLSADDKQELLRLFESYRNQLLPLNTPKMLVHHHLRKHPHDYVAAQHYLAPFPDELTHRMW